ncbi:hypothetical protein ACNO7N_05990 [Bisgaard Taxon 45]
MKKILQISLASLFAVSLVACDNTKNTTTNTEPSSKAEITLSPQEQFRKDYEAFDKWQVATEQKMNNEVKALQQKVAEMEKEKQLSPEEINTLTLNLLRTQLQTAHAELERLQLKDPDVLRLAKKTKEAHIAAIDTHEQVVKATVKPLRVQKDLAVLDTKLKAMNKLETEVQSQKEKLKQRYQQK